MSGAISPLPLYTFLAWCRTGTNLPLPLPLRAVLTSVGLDQRELPVIIVFLMS